MGSWIHCFWLEVRQTFLMAAGMCGKPAYLMVARKEGEREGKAGRKEENGAKEMKRKERKH